LRLRFRKNLRCGLSMFNTDGQLVSPTRLINLNLSTYVLSTFERFDFFLRELGQSG
jgi:hypothetical protein